MDKVYIIFRSDVERAEEIRTFAEEQGWSKEELEGAINALRPEKNDDWMITWN